MPKLEQSAVPAAPSDGSEADINIAVVGGGPKAAALAAKAAALRTAFNAGIHVTIFERAEIGAHWNGRHGYTDGTQRLCTPAERDLGFPYSSIYGPAVDAALHSGFSWAQYLLSQRRAYGDWIDSGRKAPLHSDFAAYLRWAVMKADATVVRAEVSSLRVGKDGRWAIYGARRNLAPGRGFDGVVVASPGPARGVARTGKSSRVFDGVDFWRRLGEVRKALRRQPLDPIVIVGGGGTAAAILAWLTRNGYKDREIVMLAKQAALFTRGDSFFENRLFRHDDAWQALSRESQREFVGRLNRGVVWQTVMDEVAGASKLEIRSGQAKRIVTRGRRGLFVEFTGDDGKVQRAVADIVVDASGFDAWWFMDLLKMFPRGKRASADFRSDLEESMSKFLHFAGKSWKLPPFHAPFHASRHGPGLSSLMSLGSMSDRILMAYLEP
jgi:mycobactin lysine-N-oxygenase